MFISIAKLNDRCFCYVTAAMFVSLWRAQTWRLQTWRFRTKLYKFRWHTSANSARMKNSRDLILGEVVTLQSSIISQILEFIYCAILTSYIRADPRTCRWLSRGCCHVPWSKWWVWRDSLVDFPQRWQGIMQGIRSRALTCSCMLWANEKGEFFQGRKQFRAVKEYDLLAQSNWTRKLLRLF